MNRDTVYQSIGFFQLAAANKVVHVEPPGVVGSKWRMTQVRFLPATAIGIEGTNYATVTVKKNTSDTLATWTNYTGGTAHVLGTPVAPTTTAAEFVVGTDYLAINDVITSSGSIVDGVFRFRWEHLSGAGN